MKYEEYTSVLLESSLRETAMLVDIMGILAGRFAAILATSLHYMRSQNRQRSSKKDEKLGYSRFKLNSHKETHKHYIMITIAYGMHVHIHPKLEGSHHQDI
jgi:hypothetical protein